MGGGAGRLRAVITAVCSYSANVCHFSIELGSFLFLHQFMYENILTFLLSGSYKPSSLPVGHSSLAESKDVRDSK
jgi:hypothetical protein